MSVKTPRFSGPFKWSALRQQLLSLRDDVHTIRKVAGRNVTISEHRGKGKIINARRDRSAPPPTGCPCSLPAGDCVHVLCFGLKLDAAEVEYGGQGGDPFAFASYGLIPYYAEDGPGWYFESPTNELYIPFDPADIKDKKICFQLVLIYHAESDQFEAYLIIDGVQSDSVFDDSSLVDDGSGTDRLQIGCKNAFGNPTHRTIYAPTILTSNAAQFPTGVVFRFPTDSFTSTSGSTISFSGDEIRIDTDATSGSVYAQKDFDPFYHVTCNVGACCIDSACSIKTEAECTDAGGTYIGDNIPCSPDPCCTPSKTVSLSDITFCTDDCIFISSEDGFKISDDTVSGGSYTLEGGYFTDEGCAGCVWDSLTLGTQPNIKVHEYTDGFCTGSSTDSDDTAIIVAARIDDTYYVYVYAGFRGRLLSLFYGSGSDPSEITNTLSGCTDGFNLNDQFSDCVFGDGTPGSGLQITTVMATGGTASFS